MNHTYDKLAHAEIITETEPNDKLVLDFTLGTLGCSNLRSIFGRFSHTRNYSSDEEMDLDDYKRGFTKFAEMVEKTGWAAWQPPQDFKQVLEIIDAVHEPHTLSFFLLPKKDFGGE